jgi:hypothetical protein
MSSQGCRSAQRVGTPRAEERRRTRLPEQADSAWRRHPAQAPNSPAHTPGCAAKLGRVEPHSGRLGVPVVPTIRALANRLLRFGRCGRLDEWNWRHDILCTQSRGG